MGNDGRVFFSFPVYDLSFSEVGSETDSGLHSGVDIGSGRFLASEKNFIGVSARDVAGNIGDMSDVVDLLDASLGCEVGFLNFEYVVGDSSFNPGSEAIVWDFRLGFFNTLSQ